MAQGVLAASPPLHRGSQRRFPPRRTGHCDLAIQTPHAEGFSVSSLLALPADFSNMRYMQKSILASLCFLFFAPLISHAGVVINEIAWMGTETSGSDEWIELYNNGNASADLSQWMLEAEDGSPAIALSGSINAGAYFLIERTDDTTVPDIPADLVAPFGNGLSNAGETLWLKNADGTTVDTVLGGEDWENIGGDNNTKQTAQRTSSGWITATATPRAENFAPPVSLPESEEAPASSGSASAIAPPPASSGSARPSPYPRKEIGRSEERRVGKEG